jgi:hypothetical protein
MLTFNISFARQSLALFEIYHRPSCRSFIDENTHSVSAFFQREQMQNTLAAEYVNLKMLCLLLSQALSGPKMGGGGT